MNKLNLLFFATFLVILFACGDDGPGGDDCTAAQFNSEVQAAVNDVNAAANVYAADPTQSNCNAFKDAANDYLDVVEGFDSCAGLNQTDYDQAVEAARQSVASIPC